MRYLRKGICASKQGQQLRADTMKKSMSLTVGQAVRACDWFRSKMGMLDWQFRVCVEDARPEGVCPDSCGSAITRLSAKDCLVWVGPGYCARNEYDPLWVLFHECLHCFAIDNELALDSDDTNKRREYGLDRLAELCVVAFRGGMKP